MSSVRQQLGSARRIVVKLGSALLAGEDGDVVIASVARDVARFVRGGGRAVVVSSGAVACGLEGLGLDVGQGAGQGAGAGPGGPRRTIVEKQAAAALGQPVLIARWAHALSAHGLRAGQVLLTSDDFENRTRYLNAHRTLATLLDHAHIPVVNENDSVAFDELRLGDNDRLSALVARAIEADLLVMLSVARGVADASGHVFDELASAEDGQRHVRDERTGLGTGGMATKLDAASIACHAGVHTVIAPGLESGVLVRILAGEPIGTLIPGQADASLRGRRRWIGAAARVEGRLVVDDGAARALLERGASLLPIGVREVRGEFEAGAGVDIVDTSGRLIARGLASYASSDLRRIAGHPGDAIKGILGYLYGSSVVHRDDLVLLGSTP